MQRKFIYNKGGERYIFIWNNGEESELLDAVHDLAKSKRTEFDWYDAAIISFKLIQNLVDRANAILDG